MDKKDSSWTKAEFKEFANFFNGEVGQKYLEKLKDARDAWINAALNCEVADQALTASRTARGFDLVISDIYAGIEEAKDKKEATAKEK
jgi:hypothetical protein